MKNHYRFISFFLLLWLTACGTVIRIEDLSISFPDRITSTAPATVNPSPTAIIAPTATQIGGLQAFTRANVNLRTEPSTAAGNASIIRVLLTGTEIRLIGRLADSTWARTFEGWVYTQNLNISGNITSLPIVSANSATPEPTPTQERAKSRFSYNINGEAVPDETRLMHVMTNPCKTTALVMNNLGLAVRIKQACPETIVISRNYCPCEGDEWERRTPQQIVNQWLLEGHKEIVRHSTNEPSFGGTRTAQFIAAEIELMRLARANGFTVAMGNFSVGIIRPEDIDAGIWDSYIRAIILYRHYLGLHEYAVVALPFGVGQWQTSYLLDRNRVQPASWPSALALPVRYWGGELPPYWYELRGVWWLLRADTIGVARPSILLTEFGWDNLPNIKADIEPLRQQFGLPQYFRDMRGVNTYPRLWAWYWPQWSFWQAACEQLKWADSIYPPEYLGFALFTWSSRRDWAGFDFSGRENPAMFELHECLEAA